MKIWSPLLLLTALVACSVAHKPPPLALPSPSPQPAACVLPPEPEFLPIRAEYVGDPGSTCLAPHIVCLDLVATQTLTKNLNAAKAWREEVQARCGSVQPAGAPSGSGANGSSGAAPSGARNGSATPQGEGANQ